MSKARRAISAWSIGILYWQTSKGIYLSLWQGLAFISKSKGIKMEKQDLQAGESKWQNSNSTLARPRNKRHQDMNRGRWF